MPKTGLGPIKKRQRIKMILDGDEYSDSSENDLWENSDEESSEEDEDEVTQLFDDYSSDSEGSNNIPLPRKSEKKEGKTFQDKVILTQPPLATPSPSIAKRAIESKVSDLEAVSIAAEAIGRSLADSKPARVSLSNEDIAKISNGDDALKGKRRSKLKLRLSIRNHDIDKNGAGKGVADNTKREEGNHSFAVSGHRNKGDDNSKKNTKEKQGQSPDHSDKKQSKSTAKGSTKRAVLTSPQDVNSHVEHTGVKRKKRKVATQHAAGETKSTTSSSENASTIKVQADQPIKAQLKKHTEKKKKNTFQSQVLSHVLTTMKPFTLKSLASELRTTDIALHHLMLSLIDKKCVRKKEVGSKRKKDLYWVDIGNATKELYGSGLINREETESATNILNECLSKESSIGKDIQGMTVEYSNGDLKSRLASEEELVVNFEKTLRETKERIGATHSTKDGGQSLTLNQINIGINQARNEWKRRKEKCNDFIDNLADAMEKRPKDVNKLLDIETDEAMDVKIPPKRSN